MKYIQFFFIFLMVYSLQAQSTTKKGGDLGTYRRSSLCTILAGHPTQKYGKAIDSVFSSLPFPDKYEDHNVGARYLLCTPKEKRVAQESIQTYIDTSCMGQKLVAKWFNRNPQTGTFDVSLLAERGNYNASMMDVKEALMSKRGLSLLSDAGEELIENTFFIVSDIVYVDKEENAKIAMAIFSALAAVAVTTSVATSASSSTASAAAGIAGDVAILGAVISSSISGFTVKIASHLYQLDWNDSIAAVFYNNYWCDTSYPSQEIAKRKNLFDSTRNLFNFKYVGSYNVKSEKTVLKGLYSNEDVIRKVCARALDKSIVGLQKNYEVFKVKTPVYGIEENYIQSQVGMKEGISSSSKFEVLLKQEGKDGLTFYSRVALVKPVKGKIWDNRFMAAQEESKEAGFGGTTFKKISGGEVFEGMLIRQLK